MPIGLLRSSHSILVMSLRTPTIAANWKAYQSIASARRELAALARDFPKRPRMELILCLPFPVLAEAKRLLRGCPALWGGQDVFWEGPGPYTGEVTASQLVELGCTAVIIGHSERRLLLGETDAMVRQKLLAAFALRLNPILCIGEPLNVRQKGETAHYIERQLRAALVQAPPPFSGQRLFVTYEPIWAISRFGSGEAIDPAEAGEPIEVIRSILLDHYGAAITARSTRLLYGGSVTPDNVSDYVGPSLFDGALVGAASLTAKNLIRFNRTISLFNHAHQRPRTR